MKRGAVFSLIFALVLTAVHAGAGEAQPTAQTKHEPKQSSDATHYEITGIVISSAGGGPVPHCHLTPTLIGRGGPTGREASGTASSLLRITAPIAMRADTSLLRFPLPARGVLVQAREVLSARLSTSTRITPRTSY